jgi:sulfate adenylyltransferase large subunit
MDPTTTDLPPLHCATAGSVDDGKSTLIGRLLYDAKALHTDQIAHVTEWSHRRGLARTDLALLTDGLRAEREQGITIDVAWRYFATPLRRFILADAPGHVQYTRNMVTAASRADVAIILVDARRGLTEQTRRHLFVARLLGVRSVTIAVNKMDQVGFALEVYAGIRDEITAYLASIHLPRRPAELAFVPVSALLGDNVVDVSNSMPWYDGPTLLAHLERLPVDAEREGTPARFPVQYVIRPQSASHPDFRGYAGRIVSGSFRRGDAVRVLPAGLTTTVQSIETPDGPIDEASAGSSVVLTLATDLDVGRGDWLVPDRAPLPRITRDVNADVAWVHKDESKIGVPYILKGVTREVRASIEALEVRYDVTSGAEVAGAEGALGLNDLARVRLRTSEPIPIDAYADLRATGSFLLIDATSGDTVAAGMAR